MLTNEYEAVALKYVVMFNIIKSGGREIFRDTFIHIIFDRSVSS